MLCFKYGIAQEARSRSYPVLDSFLHFGGKLSVFDIKGGYILIGNGGGAEAAMTLGSKGKPLIDNLSSRSLMQGSCLLRMGSTGFKLGRRALAAA